jgi:hypothetical protein
MPIEQKTRQGASNAKGEGNKSAPAIPAIVWQGADYPRIKPGMYQVRGTKVQGPEWVRKYQRWSLRIEFALVSEPGNVSAFFNLGSNPDEPRIGRQSKYWKDWVLANEDAPRKGQQMDPQVFLEGQFFIVTIDDGNKDSEGKPKADGEVYSRITKFHTVEWA